jgi:glucose/arabinose dehydrogenase
MFKLSIALTLTACAFLLLPLEKSSNAKPSKQAPQQQAINLTRLYNDTCAKCHGEQGEGGGGGTKTLLTLEKFGAEHDKPFFDAIKKGVPDMGMDAYGPTMSDETIWGLVVHLRELQNKYTEALVAGPKETEGVYASQRAKFRLETVVEKGKGLAVPWGIDWLPDGKMLITNRPGTLRLSQNGEVGPEITGLPPIREIGQGGLMDVAVHPNYAKNGWVYLSLTDPSPSDPKAGMTKIVRGKLKIEGLTASWHSEQTIYQSKPETYSPSGVHFGSRIVFDKKGHVFFSHGERGSGEKAQDLALPNGKIFRVNEDGSIPKDNPFVKDTNQLPAIWSWGHRNPQGLVMDLKGNLWDTEHGPRGGDELNVIQKGANYGWPIIATSINYNDSPLALPWPKEGQNFATPTLRWLPSIGACGLDVMQGSAFPEWKGDLVAGGLALGGPVFRIRVQNGKVVEEEKLFWRQGRVRDVAVGPDGMVYVALNQPDKIIRLVPVK